MIEKALAIEKGRLNIGGSDPEGVAAPRVEERFRGTNVDI